MNKTKIKKLGVLAVKKDGAIDEVTGVEMGNKINEIIDYLNHDKSVIIDLETDTHTSFDYDELEKDGSYGEKLWELIEEWAEFSKSKNVGTAEDFMKGVEIQTKIDSLIESVGQNGYEEREKEIENSDLILIGDMIVKASEIRFIQKVEGYLYTHKIVFIDGKEDNLTIKEGDLGNLLSKLKSK